MYRFKLEALLTHRRHQEEKCQKELAQARRKLSDERVKLEQKKRKKQEYLEILKSRQKRHTNVTEIILYTDYIQELSKGIESQTVLVNESIRTVDLKRQELVVVMKKYKTLKKLKYREMQAYQRKLLHDERKLMDEFASIRHFRKV
ncbi:MAG: flagellar export protein FliJ [Desulfobacterales bacterium]|jgi:flagellar export protein FliJ